MRSGLKSFTGRYGRPTALVAAGGVAANQAIRKVLHQVAFEAGTGLVAPPPSLCTDNGAMIAWAGAERLALGLTDTLDTIPHARWPLAEVRGSARPQTAQPIEQMQPAPPTDQSTEQRHLLGPDVLPS